jgi:hypothetical protein
MLRASPGLIARSLWPAALLLLFLLLLLAACSSQPVSREDEAAAAFADLRSAIQDIVADADRQTEVLGIIDELEQDVDHLRDLLIRRRIELRELNADYDATREDFLEFTSRMEARIQNGRRKAIQQQIELSDTMTEGERASLAKAQTKAMRSIVRSVQGL